MRQFDHFVAALQGRLFDESAVIVAVIAALLLMRWIWKLVYFVKSITVVHSHRLDSAMDMEAGVLCSLGKHHSRPFSSSC